MWQRVLHNCANMMWIASFLIFNLVTILILKDLFILKLFVQQFQIPPKTAYTRLSITCADIGESFVNINCLLQII